MSCFQMSSNLIGYGGEPTNLAHEKACFDQQRDCLVDSVKSTLLVFPKR
ncbi:hypothetical protein FOXB_16696 [Fusarium oxysporum f. sp. conglutinans Fo5176]|uniref:Uncharacterized protein n=1 Tax=Fusarium oxysporum (strain Fo5176) TaxID=660025 RepID=F9GDG2_FUSOF|nr:hypothetical protein FOXB_16696 [Fusarium oxysporum f. sp. conglutinans Fo5176]